ncbi:MAG: hypothetical protein GC159_09400 [Phycisphaera sp.]|nr:hypothetical protein [Phycisphaera sp.]
MRYVCMGVAAVMVVGVIASALGAEPSKQRERHFTTRDSFKYDTPILYESDFASTGLDRLNLSIDGRYSLANPEPERLALVEAPGGDETTKAVRFTVPRVADRYRAEISLPHEKGFNERWYGVRMYVPEDWKIDDTPGADIVIQWHAIPGNSKPTHPNLDIAIQGASWWVHRYYGAPDADRDKRHLDAAMTPGTWSTWIIHAKWSPGEDGLTQIWKDGRLLVDVKGANAYGTLGVEYTPYLKTGIYHPEWHVDTDLKKARFAAEQSAVARKQTYVAKVVVGDERATYELIASRLAEAGRSEK